MEDTMKTYTLQWIDGKEFVLVPAEEWPNFTNAMRDTSIYQSSTATLKKSIDSVEDIIKNAYEDSADQETLLEIAQTLDIELTREIEFSATMTVTGRITVDLINDEDFESIITDSLYADANHGNVLIDDYEVDTVTNNSF